MKITDMHCDTISRIYQERRQGKHPVLRSNSFQTDLEKMKQAGYLLQNFAMFLDIGQTSVPYQNCKEQIRLFLEEMEKNQDIIRMVTNYNDIMENQKQGKMSALMTLEEGEACEGSLDKLREFYRLGVRMMTFTWNYPNSLGFPGEPAASHLSQSQGLTPRGMEFLEEMERLGIIPDVSHLSDAGFYNVLAVTKKPFVASHSDARAVCPNVRNMTDDMIAKLSERGGVMGLNFCADFLEEKPLGEENPGTIAAVVRHAKHIVNVGGIDVLGLGSDYDGIPTHRELPGAQSMGRLWDAFHDAGFSEGELDKIFYGNVLRVYKDTLM